MLAKIKQKPVLCSICPWSMPFLRKDRIYQRTISNIFRIQFKRCPFFSIFYMERQKKHVKCSHLIPLLGPGDFSLLVLTHMLRWWMVYETKRIRARVRVCMMYRTTFFSFNRMMVIGCSLLLIPCFCFLRYVSFWVCTGCSCSNYKSSLGCSDFVLSVPYGPFICLPSEYHK